MIETKAERFFIFKTTKQFVIRQKSENQKQLECGAHDSQQSPYETFLKSDQSRFLAWICTKSHALIDISDHNMADLKIKSRSMNYSHGNGWKNTFLFVILMNKTLTPKKVMKKILDLPLYPDPHQNVTTFFSWSMSHPFSFW